MAQALFVTTNDIVSFSAMNGSVDPDNFIQWVKVAQDTEIQNYLGTDLYNKINDDIIADTLANPYLALVNDYIKPMVIHWAMVQYLPWVAYTIANRGVYKHTSENAESVTKTEVDYLVEKERSIAMSYTERFIKYMCYHKDDFPEYSTNTNEDMKPSKANNSYGGWQI